MKCDVAVLEIFIDPNYPPRVTGSEATGLRHIAFNIDSIADVAVACEEIRTDFFDIKCIFIKDYVR